MIKRFQESLLRELLELFPVVAVVGPRLVGKTTLVTSEEIGAGRSYLSLDDIRNLCHHRDSGTTTFG